MSNMKLNGNINLDYTSVNNKIKRNIGASKVIVIMILIIVILILVLIIAVIVSGTINNIIENALPLLLQNR